jgi:hypothetical protein
MGMKKTHSQSYFGGAVGGADRAPPSGNHHNNSNSSNYRSVSGGGNLIGTVGYLANPSTMPPTLAVAEDIRSFSSQSKD